METLQNIKLSFKCPKQLNELQPCNGDWYCDGCQKIVHDFRGMTEGQVMDAFAKSNSQVCGLFEADRIQVLPQQKWSRWLSAAMLALGMTTLHERLYAQVTPVADTSKANKITTFKMGELQVLPGQKFSKEAIVRAQKDMADKVVFGGVGYEPEFPGGEQALRLYLKQAIENPNDLKGKAYISFTVDTDGSIADVKILRTNMPGVNYELIKAIKDMPKWKPAMGMGKAVRRQYSIPVILPIVL